MKKLYLIGVNGNARDIVQSVRRIRDLNPDFPIPSGYLDDQVPVGTLVDGVEVIGKLKLAETLREACFVNAIGSPESYLRKQVILKGLNVNPASFVSVVDPSAVVASDAQMGRGSVLLSNVSVGSGVVVGDHVMVLQNTVLSHDSVLENESILATGIRLSGGVRIGRCAYVGSGVTIRGGLSVGEGSLVGMGSVVLESIPKFEVWCGNPAHRLRAIPNPLSAP